MNSNYDLATIDPEQLPKGKTTVEYVLRDTNKPIGASSYQHTFELPHPFQGEMPSIKDLTEAIDQLKEDQDGEPTAMSYLTVRGCRLQYSRYPALIPNTSPSSGWTNSRAGT